MTETTRIRWTDTRDSSGDPAFAGHVGDLSALFKIHPPEDPGDEWLLTSTLPGKEGERLYGFPTDLKAEAERWLEEFVTSLGAVFSADTGPRREDVLRKFAPPSPSRTPEPVPPHPEEETA